MFQEEKSRWLRTSSVYVDVLSTGQDIGIFGEDLDEATRMSMGLAQNRGIQY